MKKLDKKIFETLMNIKKGCINLTSIYGSCEGCPFNIGDMCIMEELGNELALLYFSGILSFWPILKLLLFKLFKSIISLTVMLYLLAKLYKLSPLTTV